MKKILTSIFAIASIFYLASSEIEFQNKSPITDGEAYRKILAYAENRYPDQYDMQLYTINNQLDAYQRVQNYKNDIAGKK